MASKWQNRWFESYEESELFAKSIWSKAWEVEIRKVNKANKVYTHGFTVRWYWKKEAL